VTPAVSAPVVPAGQVRVPVTATATSEGTAALPGLRVYLTLMSRSERPARVTEIALGTAPAVSASELSAMDRDTVSSSVMVTAAVGAVMLAHVGVPESVTWKLSLASAMRSLAIVTMAVLAPVWPAAQERVPEATA